MRSNENFSNIKNGVYEQSDRFCISIHYSPSLYLANIFCGSSLAGHVIVLCPPANSVAFLRSRSSFWMTAVSRAVPAA